MDFQNFKKTIMKVKKEHPIWFGLEPDSVAKDDDIYNAEKALKATLPDEYKKFLKEFGGGYFAFSVIFSLDPNSDWNLIKQNEKYNSILNKHIIFSDNESGDFYGFFVEENKCNPEIFFYDHEIDQWIRTKFDNLFAFLVEDAFHKT